MSMIIATFENGELMSSRADNFFRYHDGEVTQVKEDGHVDGPIGHFTLRKVERKDIAAYVSKHGDPWASRTLNVGPGWYIDVRGEDGAVWAFYYGDDYTMPEEQARADFAVAERLHNDWLGEVEPDEEPEPDEEVVDAAPWVMTILNNNVGQVPELVTGHTEAEEAASCISPHPELTEVVDPEHGLWNVWLPNYMTDTAWCHGLVISLQARGYVLTCDHDPL